MDAPEEIAQLNSARGRQLGRLMKEKPFIAIVFDDDHLRIYHHDLPADRVASVAAIVEQLGEHE